MAPQLTVALLLIVALQRGGAVGGGPMPASSEPTQFERFASTLKLDDKRQLPAVQQIFMMAAADASPFEQSMVRLRLRMVELAAKPEEFAPVVAEYATAAAKMASVEVRAFGEVRDILRPNQRSKTAEAFGLMAGIFHPPTPRFGGRGRRGGTGGERALISTVSVTSAEQRGGTRGGAGMGAMMIRPTRLAVFVAMFSMTDAQKKRTKDILDAEYRAAAPLRDALTKTRAALGQAIEDDKEAAEIDQAVTAYAAPVSAMAASEMKALAKFLEPLEPDQRRSAATLQTVVYLMRGAFIGKKWDTEPDLRFY